MDKTLGIILSVFLLITAGIGLLVLNDPGAVLQAAGLKEGDSAEVAQAGSNASSSGETFDRKSAAKKVPPPKSETDEQARPPSREEIARLGGLSRDSMDVSRTGRFVNHLDKVQTLEPPLPELYPFSINKRTYPDAQSMNVEVVIKNASGTHWKTAYVTLRAPAAPHAFMFEISEWQIDEVVALNYIFPRTKMEDYIRGLRVVNVSGDKRSSALAERLTESRRKIIETNTGLKRRGPRTRGGVLQAPGLLGLMGSFQEPFTGIDVIRVSKKPVQPRILEITIPESLYLPLALTVSLRETSEERQEAARVVREFHDAGIEAQNSLHELASHYSEKTTTEAFDDKGEAILTSVRDNLDDFNEKGLTLAERALRSKDQEIRDMNNLVTDYSKSILSQIKFIEEKVQLVDPRFFIRE